MAHEVKYRLDQVNCTPILARRAYPIPRASSSRRDARNRIAPFSMPLMKLGCSAPVSSRGRGSMKSERIRFIRMPFVVSMPGRLAFSRLTILFMLPAVVMVVEGRRV